MLGPHCCAGLSLVVGLSLGAANGGYSLVAVYGHLIVAVLLLQSTGSGAVGFGSCGTWVQ